MTTAPDTTKALVATGNRSISLAIDADFITARDAMLEQCRQIRVVFDDAGQAEAKRAMEACKAVRLGVTATKEREKRPVIDEGNRIEALAKEAMAGVEAEENRLKGLIATHQMKVRQALEAEQRRQAEEQRQKDEAAKAQALELQRRQREADEAKRKSEEATKPKDKKKADAEAAAAQKALDDAALEAETAAFEAQFGAVAAPAVAAAPQILGKEVWKFEVLDVMAFASRYPDLCKIEISTQKVNEAIAAGTFDVPINAETTKLVGAGWAEAKLNDNSYRMAPGLRLFKTIKL